MTLTREIFAFEQLGLALLEPPGRAQGDWFESAMNGGLSCCIDCYANVMDPGGLAVPRMPRIQTARDSVLWVFD